MGTINKLAFGIQLGKILKVMFQRFPQGIQIHVVFKTRTKPANGLERLLRPFSLFDWRRIASGEKRQGQHNEHHQGLFFVRPVHGWILSRGDYPVVDGGVWSVSYL
jgi:hypothetical protein